MLTAGDRVMRLLTKDGRHKGMEKEILLENEEISLKKNQGLYHISDGSGYRS